MSMIEFETKLHLNTENLNTFITNWIMCVYFNTYITWEKVTIGIIKF
jgi:hypothetical protein